MMNENQLIETIESLEDYEAASDALVRLWENKSKHCQHLALDILLKKRGDPQLQATAFNILYSVNIDRALNFAKHHLEYMHPYLLGTVIEQITEDVSVINEKDNLRELVCIITKCLDENQFNNLDLIEESIKWFQETFASQRHRVIKIG